MGLGEYERTNIRYGDSLPATTARYYNNCVFLIDKQESHVLYYIVFQLLNSWKFIPDHAVFISICTEIPCRWDPSNATLETQHFEQPSMTRHLLNLPVEVVKKFLKYYT